MKFYFLSSLPASLTVGGAYFGTVGTFEKYAEIEPSDNLYAFFAPQGALPVGFFLNETLRLSPPEGVEVYLLRDGVALYVKEYPPSDFSLYAIAQEKYTDGIATLFRQGTVQLSVEFFGKFFVCPLSFRYEQGKLFRFGNLIAVEGEGELSLFDLRGKRVLCEREETFAYADGILYLDVPLGDKRNTLAKKEYTLSDDGCFLYSSKLLPRAEELKRDVLLPYAFFETLLYGGDYAAFLSDTLKARANELPNFIGEFLSVVFVDEDNEIALVRQKSERLFSLSYYKLTVIDGKIDDISE